MIEPLEHRRHLSATLDADGDSLLIEGTDAADVITVARKGRRIVVTDNGVRTAFPAAGVSRVDVRAGAGDDRVWALCAATDFRISVLGEDGDDLLCGGAGNDYLRGGPGVDRVLGRAGDDLLAGDGADLLDAGPGDDELRIGGAEATGSSPTGSGGIALGGPGDDAFTFVRDTGIPQTISGGPGADSATLQSLPPGVVVDFIGPYTPGIESISYTSRERTADPLVRLTARQNDDGTVSLIVEASHNNSGYARHFGELTRIGQNPTSASFVVEVTGTDLAGPDAARRPAVESETREYSLGVLPDGTHNVRAFAGPELKATLAIRVTPDGLRDLPPVPAGMVRWIVPG